MLCHTSLFIWRIITIINGEGIMKVLIACEYSGTVRDAFIKLGHDAISCDLLPSDKPGPHYQGNVFDIVNDGFDLMIAHPPCTYLCNSGVTHLYNKDKTKNQKRWLDMRDGALFFRKLLESNIPKICIENPVMHGHAKRIINQNQTQIIQPWMFGHTESKATCLWLKGLAPLEETNNVKEDMLKLPKNQQQRLHYLPPGPDRWKLRSTTFQGIADAMAEQWGMSTIDMELEEYYDNKDKLKGLL